MVFNRNFGSSKFKIGKSVELKKYDFSPELKLSQAKYTAKKHSKSGP